MTLLDNIYHFKVFGETRADLTIRATTTQLYVCRVNNYCSCVFSEWVKVKVLDIDKSGMHCAILHTVCYCTDVAWFLLFYKIVV